ncbi:hypothetical protein B0T17DRAFT_484762, partial [Bombardia bombarda]
MEETPPEDINGIYNLAVECEDLFADHVSRLNREEQKSGAAIVSELGQRFAIWASFLGVFADPKISLDRRLRHHADIQDQVLRLLDIMQQNLLFLYEPNRSPEAMKLDSNSGRISYLALEAITGAIKRLNQLGIAIRRSPVARHSAKAKILAEKFNLTTFAEIANHIIKALYPGAGEDLMEHLARSMIDTYVRYLERKSRHEKLQLRRPQPVIRSSLLAIIEEPTTQMETEGTIGVEVQMPQHSVPLKPTIHHHHPPSRPSQTFAQSEPTSFNSHEVNKRLRRMVKPSIKSKTKSILTNQANYPRMAKGSMSCEWCFSPLQIDTLEGTEWNQHINEDHLPYVCVSDKCGEPLIRFASSTEWFQHMLTVHGRNWNREVYAPSTWKCPLCNDDDTTFIRPIDLAVHIEGFHQNVFTEHQSQAIVRQSRFRSPRARDICPLCCFSMDQND